MESVKELGADSKHTCVLAGTAAPASADMSERANSRPCLVPHSLVFPHARHQHPLPKTTTHLLGTHAAKDHYVSLSHASMAVESKGG